ncbi:MAG TPA: flavodoxin-dependent (E)-4-hydroxy-3-methylbut-2-enyl-diphosphate synthase, partial [Clostridia bacterium]
MNNDSAYLKRKETKKIPVGDIFIGGDSPITVQSMTNTDTRDIAATINQIKFLEDAGCDIVRVAIPDQEAAMAVKSIKKGIKIPLVADIHFDYRLAIESMKNGVDKIRINPGNIGGNDAVKAVVDMAKSRNIPIRVGVNSGSLKKE